MEDKQHPITVDDGVVEYVDEFQYLGSLIVESGHLDEETVKRIAAASRAFGALNRAVFKERHKSANTKRQV